MLEVLKKTIDKSWRVNINIDDIYMWLDNFTGRFYSISSERKVALWLLCNFTFYNEDEINHLCSILFRKLLHQLLIDNSLSTEQDAESCIIDSAFTSIGMPSESGSLMLYHFRQENNLDLQRFIFPTEMCSTSKSNIICIDDVMLSGGTASRFFFHHKDDLGDKKIYYLSIITTDDAITKLSALGVKMIYCIKLDERNKLFSDNSLAFYKYQNIKPYAHEIIEGYGKIIEPDKPLGYKNGQYCFGLYFNVPNNSLPIFWSTSNSWNPIFPRKEKYQNAKEAKREYGYFI